LASLALLVTFRVSSAALIGLQAPDTSMGEWPLAAMYDVEVTYDATPPTGPAGYGLLTIQTTALVGGVSTLDLVGPPSLLPSPNVTTDGSLVLTTYIEKSAGGVGNDSTGTLLITADLTAAPGLETTLYGSQRPIAFGWDDRPNTNWGAGQGYFEFEFLDDETLADQHLLADLDWPARVIAVPFGLWDAQGQPLPQPDFNADFTNVSPDLGFPLGKADAFPEPSSLLLAVTAGVSLLCRRRSPGR
jgi:hypothetical protein